ncbi:MAG: hypothetical protein HYR85_17190 [Planctomycetes bacterium]|nr:hypothetical protein [Planctomycetota bacterium]MBI3845376.1 hypothetical protein [Planctomycetota bacterium]
MKKLVAIGFCATALVALGTALYADNGPNHQVRQARPISLGTSGGNITDITTFFCCSGTLGSEVKNSAGTKFILSNNHVLAKGNNGHVGDAITQPGMVDTGCAQITADTVANLSSWVTITKSRSANNRVDGAVAQVVAGAVTSTDNILDIGCVTGSASVGVGAAVRKSGRTTGFTSGSVAAVNVTILVGYPNSCGSNSTKAARFIGQIQVTPGSFLGGGDSGSLMVDSSTRAVGLLFAGGSSAAFANPIGDVLSQMPGGPYTMVTCTGFADASPNPNEDWDPMLMDAMAIQSSLEDYLHSIRREIPTVIGIGIGASTSASNPYALEIYVDVNDPRFSDDASRLPGEWGRMDVNVVPIDRPIAN